MAVVGPVEVQHRFVAWVCVSSHYLVRGVVLAVLDIVKEGRDLVNVVLLVETGQGVVVLRLEQVGRDTSRSCVGTQRWPRELGLGIALEPETLMNARRNCSLRVEVVASEVPVAATSVHLISRVRRGPVDHRLGGVSVPYRGHRPLCASIVCFPRIFRQFGEVGALIQARHLAARRDLPAGPKVHGSFILLHILLIAVHRCDLLLLESE